MASPYPGDPNDPRFHPLGQHPVRKNALGQVIIIMPDLNRPQSPCTPRAIRQLKGECPVIPPIAYIPPLTNPFADAESSEGAEDEKHDGNMADLAIEEAFWSRKTIARQAIKVGKARIVMVRKARNINQSPVPKYDEKSGNIVHDNEKVDCTAFLTPEADIAEKFRRMFNSLFSAITQEFIELETNIYEQEKAMRTATLTTQMHGNASVLLADYEHMTFENHYAVAHAYFRTQRKNLAEKSCHTWDINVVAFLDKFQVDFSDVAFVMQSIGLVNTRLMTKINKKAFEKVQNRVHTLAILEMPEERVGAGSDLENTWF